jgi:hypothetical protein
MSMCCVYWRQLPLTHTWGCIIFRTTTVWEPNGRHSTTRKHRERWAVMAARNCFRGVSQRSGDWSSFQPAKDVSRVTSQTTSLPQAQRYLPDSLQARISLGRMNLCCPHVWVLVYRATSSSSEKNRHETPTQKSDPS